MQIEADKRYGDNVALDGATLSVERGTIHALVGENGAGKSTLLKVAFGLVRADRATIAIGGQTIDPTTNTPRVARGRGLGLVQQHGALVGSLSVVENAVLGRAHGAWVELAAPAASIDRVAKEIGLEVDPWAIVDALPVGVAQRAEIAIALEAGAKILALDEPTALLTPQEVAGLFAALRTLVARGDTVILVTHKLDEVRAIADRVTVLRAGKTVATFAGDAPTDEIVRAMVGTEIARVSKPPPPRDEIALSIEGIEVKRGEIVGVAGVEGNGQRELVAAAARTIPRAALALIPEDRHAEGLVLPASVADNLALGRLDELGLAGRRAHAAALCKDFDIRPADPDAIASSLSGGNQQKVVVARELTRPGVTIVIAAQPTRGVDLAAIALIHARLRAAAEAGAAVLLVSADLDEILALAHRAVVLYRGEVAGGVDDLAAPDAREQLGALMTGARA
ncbi:MAG TPA: ATP-binding cassette domain-containing protein [Kofleriaceae bacterium]|nr:ATP-binding cassette domain-containing protein [Kofleriaceae bacterium]